MDKEHFLTRLGQWPKIHFSEVCITVCGGSPSPELYVRDRADPPCWLFIRRLVAGENSDSVLARYSQWLVEFHRERGNDFCLLSPHDDQSSNEPAEEQTALSPTPLPLVTER